MTTRMKTALQALGIETHRKPDGEVHLETTLSGLRRFQDSGTRLPWKQKSSIRERFAVSPRLDCVDMQAFERQFKQLLENGLRKDLETQLLPCIPKRKRRFSEHDGEWSYDRRWEIEPFSQSVRKFEVARIVEISAQFNAIGSVHTEDLDRYGTLVWAICRLLETCGVQTGVTWTLPCFGSGNGMPNCFPKVRVKNPGEYLAPSLLAGVFRGDIFRGLGFMLRGASCESEACSWDDAGMGRSRNANGAGIRFEKGIIYMAPDCVRGYDDALKAAILSAVRG